MNKVANSYFAQEQAASPSKRHQEALERCIARLAEQMPVIGLRNPKIGTAQNRWIYCDGPDWVMGFLSGTLWLAYQLTGRSDFARAATARRPGFRMVLENRRYRDHDLGFQFSLSSVAEWQMTGDREARRMGLAAADALLGRFRPEGGYIQAWTARGPDDRAQARFANGRMIADTMQNLALLYWANRQTGIDDYRDVADIHAETAARLLVRDDDTSFHTFLFDPADGTPLRGETHQGFADGSCWSRGQAWLIHGFAQCHAYTRNAAFLAIASRLAARAETLVGSQAVPVWDFADDPAKPDHIDSSAGAVMAAGLYLLAGQCADPADRLRWRAFADRLLDGLIATCDLTATEGAQGFLAHGAAHVPAGRHDAMLPYGDYYFMEALMRSLGHNSFFW
ncbi:glycoside hydrolase family 88 protein [Martelella sp. HB161492]|uniref:glycoside hydrolase family 88 protein n=1 Tax=Martelella sp. HB161492 TaxID=2720726 RepID=UPI00159109BF|nr:glycoside hydrolase family 88 protein [Martelella sp. HB161492]